MRVVELKELMTGTFYKPAPGETIAPKVPKGTPFDPETMIQRPFSYRANIEGILGTPPNPQQGVKVVEVRKAMRLLDLLEATDEGKPLVLEDADWSYLDERVQNTDWPFVLPAIVQFCDDIHNAKAISKERLEKAAEDTEHEAEPTGSNGKVTKMKARAR